MFIELRHFIVKFVTILWLFERGGETETAEVLAISNSTKPGRYKM